MTTEVVRYPLCILLVRDAAHTSEPILAERSRILFWEVVAPVVHQLGYYVKQVDPKDFGRADQEFFQLLKRAELVVVDPYARSSDYIYSLGARHALTSRPTIILRETDNAPFDVQILRGFFEYSSEELCTPSFVQIRFHQYLEAHIAASRDVENNFSPIADALEKAPRLFLSYAHADREAVLAVDQWLRDRGARVDLDERDFIAGGDIRDQISRCIEAAGKVICFYSKSSVSRYYTKLERRLVEEREQRSDANGNPEALLVYFRLDETPLPPEASFRLAVNAFSFGFSGACKDLWRHILGLPADPPRIDLDQYETRRPW